MNKSTQVIDKDEFVGKFIKNNILFLNKEKNNSFPGMLNSNTKNDIKKK